MINRIVGINLQSVTHDSSNLINSSRVLAKSFTSSLLDGRSGLLGTFGKSHIIDSASSIKNQHMLFHTPRQALTLASDTKRHQDIIRPRQSLQDLFGLLCFFVRKVLLLAKIEQLHGGGWRKVGNARYCTMPAQLCPFGQIVHLAIEKEEIIFAQENRAFDKIRQFFKTCVAAVGQSALDGI